MGKLKKIDTIYLICTIIGIISLIIYQNYIVDIKGTSDRIVAIKTVRVLDVSREELFNVMADIQNYPTILPENVLSVKIINQTDGPVSKIIFAEEKVSQSGITTTLIVKHDILPFDTHSIKVMSGDAEGTIIKETYNENGTGVLLTTDAQVHVHGILSPFGSLLRPNLEHAMNTIIDKFVEYAKIKQSLV